MRSRPRTLFWITLVLATASVVWIGQRASAQRKHLASELAETLAAQAATQAEIERLRSQQRQQPRAVPNPATTAAKAPAERMPPASFMERLRNEPELFEVYIASRRAKIGQTEGRALHKAGLTRAEIESYKDIQAAKILRDVDIRAAAAAKGLPESDPAVVTLLNESRRQCDEATVALLGLERVQALGKLSWHRRADAMADALAATVAFSEPLKGDQADKLSMAIVEGSASYRSGRTWTVEDIDWAAVDAAAKTFLTPGQFAAWQTGTSQDPRNGSRLRLELLAAAKKAGLED